VRDIAEDRSHAHTASRRYDLATPLQDDKPLPQAAKDAILTRLIRNAADTSIVAFPTATELQRLFTYVEELSEAPVKRNLWGFEDAKLWPRPGRPAPFSWRMRPDGCI